MTDRDLADLFAEGTAPERDLAFAARVDAEIGRERARWPAALAVRATVALAFVAMIFVVSQSVGPVLAPLAGLLPRFMGVPVPLVLAVVAIGLALRAPRLLLPRLA